MPSVITRKDSESRAPCDIPDGLDGHAEPQAVSSAAAGNTRAVVISSNDGMSLTVRVPQEFALGPSISKKGELIKDEHTVFTYKRGPAICGLFGHTLVRDSVQEDSTGQRTYAVSDKGESHATSDATAAVNRATAGSAASFELKRLSGHGNHHGTEPRPGEFIFECKDDKVEDVRLHMKEAGLSIEDSDSCSSGQQEDQA